MTHRRFLIPFVLCLHLALLACPQAVLAGTADDFAEAWHEFHALVDDEVKSKYRINWQNLERKFVTIYKDAPEGPYAPKALFYVGRVNEELGTHSFLRSDFIRAVDYFERVATRYPAHSWTDDAIFRNASIQLEHLKDTARARELCNKVLTDYPTGDMWSKAQVLLREIIAPELPVQEVADAVPAPLPEPVATIQEPASPEPQNQEEAVQDTAALTARQENAADAHAVQQRQPGEPIHLTDLKFQSSDEYTRVVAYLDDTVRYRYEVLGPVPELDKPHRLYIDFLEAELSPSVERKLTIEDGILRRVRSAQNKPDVVRVVLDFQDMQEYHIFHLDNPFRLIVDVSAPVAPEVLTSAIEPVKPETVQAPVDPPEPQIVQEPEVEHVASIDPNSPFVQSMQSNIGTLVEQLGLSIKTIMLDPGHGGKDPGAVGPDNTYEKDINLRFALMLGKILSKKGYDVLYTRKDDTFIPLEERTGDANVRKADLFISIHCNSNPSGKLQGIETYSLGQVSNEDAERVARRENGGTERTLSQVDVILTDLLLNSKIEESSDLAKVVHAELVKSVKQKYTVRDHGTRTALFHVLIGSKMPAILLELGYISHPEEAKRLSSDDYLMQTALGIAQGIEDYKDSLNQFAQR